jgi:hypothetical protein
MDKLLLYTPINVNTYIEQPKEKKRKEKNEQKIMNQLN